MKNNNVELLFDDIRSYIDSLEKSLKSKEKELELKNKRIEILEKNIKVDKTEKLVVNENIRIEKSLLDVKVLYQLILSAKKNENTTMLEIFFDLLNKEQLQNISVIASENLLLAILNYSINSINDKMEKTVFIAKSLEKLNPEKLNSFNRKIYEELILEYELDDFIDEDFLIKYIRACAFSDCYDIAKLLIKKLLNEQRVITKESNKENILFIGLYLGIENTRKLSYTQEIYIKAMNKRYDNMFLNYLIGNLDFDYSMLESNIINIKILNKNLVTYIYNLVKENSNNSTRRISNHTFDANVKIKDENKKIELKRKETKKKSIIISDDKNLIKSVYVLRKTDFCDDDNTSLRSNNVNIACYNSKGEIVSRVLEKGFICKTCGKCILSTDSIVKVYKKISKECYIKISNEDKLALSMFGYNLGLSRDKRFDVLINLACPALGISKVIEKLDILIKLHEEDKTKNYDMSILEWNHDRAKLKKYCI